MRDSIRSTGTNVCLFGISLPCEACHRTELYNSTTTRAITINAQVTYRQFRPLRVAPLLCIGVPQASRCDHWGSSGHGSRGEQGLGNWKSMIADLRFKIQNSRFKIQYTQSPDG